ncbi:hypothetical protein Lal_00005839 [Lupinus albus]|nr:hypothetical protein Lal_00005839 [Lupinus albus]
MSGVVSGGFFDETKVTITNKLSQALTIHCQDKNNDDGYHVLQPSAGHRFKKHYGFAVFNGQENLTHLTFMSKKEINVMIVDAIG